MSARAAGRTGLVLLGILFTVILAGIDNTIVSTVMPTALPELGNPELYAWTFAAYMLATAVTMPIWGPGSDRWGRKRTYLAGIAVFVVGSVLCGIAPSMPLFIAARAVQGAGAGAVMSLPFIVLGVVFPPERRGRALGVVSSAWAISSVAGPLAGTAIVASVSWRWAFLLNLPIGFLAALLVWRGMQESVGERAGRFDVAGALLAGVGGSALIWAFVNLGEGRVGATEAGLVVTGLALLAAFVWHEGRAASPILPLSLFRNRGYATAMAAGFLMFFSGFALSAYLPLHTDAVFGTDVAVGVIVGAFTIGWSSCAFTAGRLVHRTGERLLGVVGLGVHATGLGALFVAFGHGLPVATLASFLAGAGMGLIGPGLTVAIQNSVDVKRMGSATTSAQFTRQVGASLGVSGIVLAASIAGFAGGLTLLLAVSMVGLVFIAAMPAHSLRGGPTMGDGGAAPTTEPSARE